MQPSTGGSDTMDTKQRDQQLIESYVADLEHRGTSPEDTGRFLQALERLYPTRQADLLSRGFATSGPRTTVADVVSVALLLAAIAWASSFQLG